MQLLLLLFLPSLLFMIGESVMIRPPGIGGQGPKSFSSPDGVLYLLDQ